MKRLRAWIERRLHPYHAVCRHCRRPWACVHPRVVHFTRSQGAFALCATCWDNATVDERLRAMYLAHGGSSDWPEIRAAILEIPEQAA